MRATRRITEDAWSSDQRAAAITVSELRKSYDGLAALNDISFSVERGEIFGLLGPNGAGKTTALECLEGLRRPDGGRLDILGIDPVRDSGLLPSVIGVQLQASSLPPTMTCDDAMRFFCGYHGVTPRWDLLDRLGLTHKRDTRYDELSTGLQRRLALTLAIAHEPRVLFLDEPTAGLDVASRVELHRMIHQLSEAGTTILLATHDMAEAEQMADRVAILLRGVIVANGTPRDLTAAGEGLTKISVRSERGSLGDGTEIATVSQTAKSDEYAVLFTREVGATVSAILGRLEAAHDPLIDLRVERPSLEERFLELTSEAATR
jgi:ABC-2 type transport system ATP-binding protein